LTFRGTGRRPAAPVTPATSAGQHQSLPGRLKTMNEQKSTYSGNWQTDAHGIDGQTGSHYDLAEWVERKGFEVRADNDDNERSIICRPGPEDAGEREIGEIVGDAEAVVTIWDESQRWTIEGRDETSGSGWSRDPIGDDRANRFDTEQEAEDAITELVIACGWNRENMRVVELDDSQNMTWYARHEGGEISELVAESRKSAIAELREEYREWGGDSTSWYDVAIAVADSAPDNDSDDWESITVTVDPTEPDCTDGEHEWESPIEIVGGIKENPGVWGHGGGVTIQEVCRKCGCGRLTDTWAQRQDTGEQGLRSVTYQPNYVEAIRQSQE
jgi:hypothetical protein